MTAKWKEVLGALAPTIGTALGGPLGGLAVSVAAEALGLPAGAKEKDLKAAVLGMTPAQHVALHQADMDYATRLAELEVDETKIHQLDRSSARSMRANMKDRTPDVLAFSITFGFFGTLYVLATQPVDPQAEKVLYAMVGVLSTMSVGVINFFFGSSKGSKAKTDILGKMGDK